LTIQEIILLALFPLGFVLAAAGSGAFAVLIFILWLQQLTIRRQPTPLWTSAILLTFVLAVLGFLLWRHM
jgi:hypothetical protein